MLLKDLVYTIFWFEFFFLSNLRLLVRRNNTEIRQGNNRNNVKILDKLVVLLFLYLVLLTIKLHEKSEMKLDKTSTKINNLANRVVVLIWEPNNKPSPIKIRFSSSFENNSLSARTKNISTLKKSNFACHIKKNHYLACYSIKIN